MLANKSFKVVLTLIVAILGLADYSSAFWRMECRARSGYAQLDPLVSYGTASEHIHSIFGGSGFSETADTDTMLASDCTSCSVAQDKSAYWTPPFYFQDATTGEFEAVQQEGGMLAYYLLFPNADETTVDAFPSGFQMIAGDTNQRNFTYPVPDLEKSLWALDPKYTSQAFLRQAAIGFNCLNYDTTPEGTLYRHFLPDKSYMDANCKDGIRAEVMFPSCWNGNTSSPDQMSHVAYPSLVMTGDCPSSHPKRLVSMLYESIWRTDLFEGRDGQFVIANGDPTGYGYHGDFIMGWEEEFLQDAVNTCTSSSGEISDCALFDIQDSDTYSACSITEPASLKTESVVSGLSSLPGNVPIMSGPGYANGATAGGSYSTDAPVAVPTLSYLPGSSVDLSQATNVVAGNVIAAYKSESATASRLSSTELPGAVLAQDVDPTPMPTPAPSTPSTSYASTEFVTNGLTVSEIFWAEEVVTITVQATETASVVGRKRHVHQHRRGN
ncbi:hypothetical protein BJ878DRAFT_56698 [Calycina marina]|uniref:DUF1996 domain-containing protein n=1 Tax=Calycina marina TaxID=1763456 RepID=A0A9P7Z3J0_9HELO|nr:hypothetical protein BJ878DRAFT_56698 [Calycina marina]